MAFGVSAGTAFIDILPKSDQFVSSMVSQVKDAVKEASGSVDTSPLTKSLNAGFLALGAAAIGGIYKGIKATQEWAGEVKGLIRVTGQSAEEASALAGAASILGISTAQLSTSFTILSRNVSSGSKNLEKYGIVTHNAEGTQLEMDEILGNIMDKFQTLPKGMEQTAFATAMFGRAGKNLIPMLSKGRDGMAELYAEAERLGVVLGQDDLDATRDLGVAQKELGLAFKGFSMSLAKDFIPILTILTKALSSVVEMFQIIPQPIRTAGLALLALNAAVIAGKGIWAFFEAQIAKTTTVLAANTVATVDNETANQMGISTYAQVADTTEELTTAAAANTVVTEAGTAATATNVTTVTAGSAAKKTFTVATELNTRAVGAEIVAIQAANASQLSFLGTIKQGAVSLGKYAGQFLATKGAVGAFIAAAIAGKLALDNALKGTSDLADEFKLTGDQAVWIEEAVDPAIGSLNDWAQAATDIPETLGIANAAETASQVFRDFGDAALAAGRSQEYVDQALQASLHHLGPNRESTKAFNAALYDYVGLTQDATGATVDLTEAERLAAAEADVASTNWKKLTDVGMGLAGTLDLMGISAKDFRAQAEQAFLAGEEAFNEWASNFRAQAKTAWNDYADTVADSVNQVSEVVSGLGTDLEEGQKLTANSILKQFEQAERATKSFGQDLLEISKRGGKAGEELASSLMESGNVMAAQVIANAPKKLQGQIVDSFGASGKTADTFGTKLTKSIVGPLEDIRDVLVAIAKKWDIELNLSANGKPITTAQASSLIAEGHASGSQDFVPTTAAGGVVTRPQIRMVGEAGPEAIIPLDRAGKFGVGGGGGYIAGTLTLTEDSRAYIEGVVDEDAGGRARHVRVLRRGGGGG